MHACVCVRVCFKKWSSWSFLGFFKCICILCRIAVCFKIIKEVCCVFSLMIKETASINSELSMHAVISLQQISWDI